ncbi:MAG: hypothetical protein FWD90_04770 [Defluviitaleaceae bacterium]|nr:hypothetical protein [Defluviitaleaceae bacterium]
MANEGNNGIAQAIERALAAPLRGDYLKNALDFTAFLTGIGMTPDPIEEVTIRFNYGGELTCILVFFKVDNDPNGLWVVCDCPISEYAGFPLSEELMNFARANVKICDACGCDHKERGATKSIFGKEYENLCSSEIQFLNPDTHALEKIKTFMEFWKHIIDDKAGKNS